MDTLIKKIPEDVKSRIAGKMAIEAGVATGPSFMVFKAEKFDPPVTIEAGLNWIEKTMKSFKGAHLKLDDFTVLVFFYDKFKRYDEQQNKEPIRPSITASGHKIEPFEPAEDIGTQSSIRLKRASCVKGINGGTTSKNPLNMESSEWKDSTAEIPIVLGIDASGKPIVADLARLSPLLIAGSAGSAGSGKSVLINSLIISMLGRFAPSELRLMLFDPKYYEFNLYASLPHLILPVINRPAELPVALDWIIDEMERRQKTAYKLPRIVIILDELADVMMTDARERVENCIGRIAQTGSSCGIYMVISTQTPRKQIITPAIDAAISARIAFHVSSESDSNVILGRKGAEKLLGRGDMLFMDSSGVDPVRLQGTMVSEGEVERVVKFISS